MTDYFIVDSHVHTFPSVDIGRQAVEVLEAQERSGGHCGTIEDTLASMERDGVSYAVMANWLPVANMRDAALLGLPYGLSDYARAQQEIDDRLIDRVIRYNQWTCDVAREHSCLIPFIGVEPAMSPDRMRQEIQDKVINHGARGLKFHPSGLRFFPHDRRLWPAYELALELDLPILAHCGVFGKATTEYAEPKYFGEVLSRFPRLRLVLAHIGLGFFDQSRALARDYPQLNFDCAELIATFKRVIPDEEVLSLFRDIGVERIMFGTDFPFYDRSPCLKQIREMKLTEEERRLILGENARRILRLE